MSNAMDDSMLRGTDLSIALYINKGLVFLEWEDEVTWIGLNSTQAKNLYIGLGEAIKRLENELPKVH